jgi:hypothetical protein
MGRLFLFLLFISTTFICAAQNVSGNWYGTGYVSGSGNTYLTELVLQQKGKSITGELNYYFRDSLFKNKILGTFDATSRMLVIKEIPIIYFRSIDTKMGVDCPLTGLLQLRVSRAESVLSGTFENAANFKYTCPPIHFKLKKQTDFDTVVVVEEKEPVADTVKKVVIELLPQEKEKLQQLAQREKIYAKEIEVNSSIIRLEFYDNGAIDHDSISVFFNGRLVLPRSMLNYRPLKLTLTLDDSLPFNELSMFAENLGEIPPNTAVLVLYDGNERHEIQMVSDLNKNATIRIIHKKKEEGNK